MTAPAASDPPGRGGGLRDDEAVLPSGLRLALRRADAAGPAPRGCPPFLLVHGLASNARLWDGVAVRLAAAGHDVVAVDQRGHGRSDAPAGGYDTDTCADDLAALCGVLGFTGLRRPVVAGQSWGASVALAFAARHRGAAALALVDGGWLRLCERFPDFADCWRVLAPPRFNGLRAADLAGRAAVWHPDWPPEAVAGSLANFRALPDGTARAILDRAAHRSILRSLWAADPRQAYPLVDCPTLLLPAYGEPPGPGDAETAAAVAEAAALLPRARVVPYPGADHDLHAQQPGRCAADLLALAAEVAP